MRRLFTFFREGVGANLIDLFATRPGHGAMMALSYFALDKNVSLVMYRTLSHEMAHALEAKVQGAKVDSIRLSMDPSGFTGATTVDDTTPTTARSIAVAGLCSDAGFMFVSSAILKRINPTAAIFWVFIDVASFVLGQDYKVLTEANKHIEME